MLILSAGVRVATRLVCRPMAIDVRAICAECGHVRGWHDLEAARSMRGGDFTSDRGCYREIGGAPCHCGGFTDSGEVALQARGAPPGQGLHRTALLTVVLIVMGLALLYAYRSQSPTVQMVSLTQAISEMNAGQIAGVTITGNRAQLELRSGERQQTMLATPDETFQRALSDYNAANPTRTITVTSGPESSSPPVILAVLLSLLPILLLGAFFRYMFSRSRAR